MGVGYRRAQSCARVRADGDERMQGTEYEAKLFKNQIQAEEVVGRLAEMGYGRDQVSLIVDERDIPQDQNFQSDTAPTAALGGMGEAGQSFGAVTGGVIGAIVASAAAAALVVGTEGVAAPFVVGPLAAVLAGVGAGAAGGSIIGGLLEVGLESDDWRTGVRNGGIVVVVSLKTEADRAAVRSALI